MEQSATSSASKKEETCEKYESLLACVEKFLKSLRDKPGSCKKFAKAFPKCYKECREILQSISDQMWEACETNQKAHIMALIEEIDLKQSLCKIANAELDENPTWRPSGNPQEDIKPWIYKAREDKIAELEKLVEEAESENHILRDKLQSKKEHINSLMEKIEGAVTDWEQMNDVCESKKEMLAAAQDQMMDLTT